MSTRAAVSRIQQAARVQDARSTNASSSAVNLPNEILSEIFEWAVQGILSPEGVFHPKSGHLQALSYRRARNRIASVCSRWRHVAVTVSSMWTKVSIYSGVVRDKKTGGWNLLNRDMLASDIKNMGPRMVSLNIYGSPYSLNDWDKSIRPTLSPFVERYRDIGFTWARWRQVDSNLSLANSQRVNREFYALFATPHVRRLCIRIFSAPPYYGDRVMDLSKARGVEDVHAHSKLTTPHDIPTSLRVPVSWNVRRLTLMGSYNLLDVIVALNSCTRLEELMLTCNFSSPDISYGDVTLKPLPFLSTLSLYEFPPASIMYGFEANALRRLRYVNAGLIDRLVDADHHFPELRQLVVLNRVDEADIQSLASFIHRHASLEEIFLPLVGLEETLAEVLTKRNGSGSFVLGKLKHLQIAVEKPPDEDRFYELQVLRIGMMEERTKDPDSCFVVHLNTIKNDIWAGEDQTASIEIIDCVEYLRGLFGPKVEWYDFPTKRLQSIQHLRGVDLQPWDWTGDHEAGSNI